MIAALFIFFINFLVPTSNLSPIEIMSKMENKINLSSMEAIFNIRTVSKKGSVNNLDFKTRILNIQDANYQMIWFLKPLNFKGISFLKIEKENTVNMKMWYPKYKKIRRIPASNLSDSFMNTELIYQDMVNRNIDDYDYTILDDQIHNDNICYVIKSIPKENTSVYSKHETWISKKDYLPLIEISYDKEMRKVKEKKNYFNKNLKIDSLIVKNIITQDFSVIKILVENTNEEFNINDFKEQNLKRVPK